MAELAEIVAYCQERLNVEAIRDFKGAENGLQVGNGGRVTRIAAVVDAGLAPFREAAARGVDLILCHHGLYWEPPFPIVGPSREKLKVLLENDIALYSAHLPLDAHRELGNAAQIAAKLGLAIEMWDLEYEGTAMAPICPWKASREALKEKLAPHFPHLREIAFGSASPEKLCIVSGSGNLILPELARLGIDTLVSGELKQSNFNQAQELGMNVFLCGHYDTETFGVKALAAEVAAKFGLPWEFLATGCPL
jgi:dinuclear metal center YbgI/SA1388 family protein